MFARVITAQVDENGSDNLIRLANQQLPGARQRPGFAGFFLLVNESTGKVINISLWRTREDMEAVAQGTPDGIHDEGVSETGLSSLRLETYEVAINLIVAP
jgi:heme-degrading monooxygenase HmoA